MPLSKSPAFQFYAAEYLADEHVALMTLEEEGVYIRLLAYCWREGSIPSDTRALSRLCKGASEESILIVKDRFKQHPNDPSRLTHSRLNKEREKQENWSKKNSVNGKKSGKARRAKKLHTERSFNDRMNESRTKSNSSFSSSSSLNTNTLPIGRESADADSPAPSIRPEDFANTWNRERGTSLSKVNEFTEDRRRKTKIRINAGLTLEKFQEAVIRCRGTPFLNGENDRGWRADYDWLMKNGTNIAKVLEGKYDGSGNGTSKSTYFRTKTDGNLEAARQAVASILGGSTDSPGDGETGDGGPEGSGAIRQAPVVLPPERCGASVGSDFP